jgi:hypothetical protein
VEEQGGATLSVNRKIFNAHAAPKVFEKFCGVHGPHSRHCVLIGAIPMAMPFGADSGFSLLTGVAAKASLISQDIIY